MTKQKNEIVHLFPTPLWACVFPNELTQSINRSILQLIEKKLQSAPEELDKTLQTEQNLHLAPEFAELVKQIYLIANNALEYLNLDYEPIQITGCWANISGMGHAFQPHTHPNNYLSGVYYVEAPAGGDTVCFLDPRPQISVIKPPLKKMMPDNTDQVITQVTSGTMLLFPSWLRHSVPRNQGENRRISVSFNLMFQQFAETMSSPLWKGDI